GAHGGCGAGGCAGWGGCGCRLGGGGGRGGGGGGGGQVDEVVAEPSPLGGEVGEVLRGGVGAEVHRGGDLDPAADQGVGLLRVVGEQRDRVHAEVGEDAGDGGEGARVHGQAEVEVRLDGVAAGVLQRVGAQLLDQADAAPLVAAQQDEHAAPGGVDAGQGFLQLGAAVAAAGAEHVPGHALGVDPGEHRLGGGDVAAHEHQVLGRALAHGARLEGAVRGGQRDRVGDPEGGPVVAPPVRGEVLDGDHRQAVLVGELAQGGAAHHVAVVVDELDDHPHRGQPREPGEVDGGL